MTTSTLDTTTRTQENTLRQSTVNNATRLAGRALLALGAGGWSIDARYRVS